MPEGDSTEYMDVVNERDEVIGRDTRANVHARHLIHRGVHVFVVNRAGELLVQRRAMAKSYYPGYWDASVGGQVGAGESYAEAAARELEEELGCSGGDLKLIGVYDSFSSRQREKRALFVHHSEGPFSFPAKEIEELRFVSPDELLRMIGSEPVTEGFRRSLALWLPGGTPQENGRA